MNNQVSKKEYLLNLFLEKFNEISDSEELKMLGFVDNKNINTKKQFNEKQADFNGAFADVQQALVNDPEEKIKSMNAKDLINYLRRAIKTNTIDEYKKDSKHLRVFVMDTGELFDDFKHIKKNHYYKKREIEKLLKQQESLKVNTIKYYLVSIGEIINLPNQLKNDYPNESPIEDRLSGWKATENFKYNEEKKDNIQELKNKINSLSTNCKNLIEEWIIKEKMDQDFNFKKWAIDRKVNYDTLKVQYKRCLDSLKLTYSENLIG
ncbi:hypothetical protein OAJ21_02045 [Pelagibacteraceae bacterium]|nr:hypothetical protein [Pelagibacteraceae bacterium]